nr:MAG TPA: hypothetical protein [Caudoviricetes sp.]
MLRYGSQRYHAARSCATSLRRIAYKKDSPFPDQCSCIPAPALHRCRRRQAHRRYGPSKVLWFSSRVCLLSNICVQGIDFLFAHLERQTKNGNFQRERLCAHVGLCSRVQRINVHLAHFRIVYAHCGNDRLVGVLRNELRQTCGQQTATGGNNYLVPAGKARGDVTVNELRHASLYLFHLYHVNTSCFKVRGGYFRPFWRLVVAAAPALRERVVERLRRCGGSGGDVRNLFGIKGRVRVGHDGVITAAAAFRLAINRSKAFLLDAFNVLTDQRKAVLRALIVHSLLTERAADVLQLPVDVLVHFEHLLISVGVGIAQRDLGLQFRDLLLLPQLIAGHRRVLAAIAVVRHRAVHGRSVAVHAEQTDTAVCKSKCSTANAKTERSSRQPLRCVAVTLLNFHVDFLL